MGKKALRHRVLYAFAALAFFAIYFFSVPFLYIIAGAAIGGLFMQRRLLQVFFRGQFDPQTRECRIEEGPDDDIDLLRRAGVSEPDIDHSLKVAEKTGATREGVLRDRLYQHGRSSDAVMFSLVTES